MRIVLNIASRAPPTVRFSALSFPTLRRFCTMSTQPNGSNTGKQKSDSGKKEVKILMIHGFTQSGALFRNKTRAIEKLLIKTLAPASLLPVLVYPTGPNRLSPSDIPGYEPPADDTDDYQPDTWAWFRKDEATGDYRFFEEGMTRVAQAIRDAGGIDGVCGFSQGGFMAGVVAAALEAERKVPDGPDGDWARALRAANMGRPVKMAISYSGFWGPWAKVQFCYEPKIVTPSLHYIGSLDTVVEESRSQALIDRCEDPAVIVHPGGHHVPVAKEWVMPLAGFIKKSMDNEPKAGL